MNSFCLFWEKTGFQQKLQENVKGEWGSIWGLFATDTWSIPGIPTLLALGLLPS